ncbi:hypothetical protein DB347_11270 [Opitutaceae bacterium EW11]|nr:hypothetical protein DB347_11270 [Opitutaceae bacterium EW11]
MSPRHTRKTFFAKLAGLIAAVGFGPKLLAKPLAALSEKAATPESTVVVRAEPRAVARTSESL